MTVIINPFRVLYQKSDTGVGNMISKTSVDHMDRGTVAVGILYGMDHIARGKDGAVEGSGLGAEPVDFIAGNPEITRGGNGFALDDLADRA
jgi:hypothetical protein